MQYNQLKKIVRHGLLVWVLAAFSILLSGCVAKSEYVHRLAVNNKDQADVLYWLAAQNKTKNPTPMNSLIAGKAQAAAGAAAKLANEDPSITGDLGGAGGLMGALGMGGTGVGGIALAVYGWYQRKQKLHTETTLHKVKDMDPEQAREHAKSEGFG